MGREILPRKQSGILKIFGRVLLSLGTLLAFMCNSNVCVFTLFMFIFCECFARMKLRDKESVQILHLFINIVLTIKIKIWDIFITVCLECRLGSINFLTHGSWVLSNLLFRWKSNLEWASCLMFIMTTYIVTCVTIHVYLFAATFIHTYTWHWHLACHNTPYLMIIQTLLYWYNIQGKRSKTRPSGLIEAIASKNGVRNNANAYKLKLTHCKEVKMWDNFRVYNVRTWRFLLHSTSCLHCSLVPPISPWLRDYR